MTAGDLRYFQAAALSCGLHIHRIHFALKDHSRLLECLLLLLKRLCPGDKSLLPTAPAAATRMADRVLIFADQRQSDMDYLHSIKEIKALFAAADYVGVKTVEAEVSLERFLVNMFSYRPALIRLLYRIRAPLVRLLGFKQDPLPEPEEWIPGEFPMLPCGTVWFFTVQRVRKNHYWIAGCPRERHLDADLAVVAQPLQGNRRRFHLITVVRFKHWTGPVYFNLIRLFNLFLVNRMAHHAAR